MNLYLLYYDKGHPSEGDIYQYEVNIKPPQVYEANAKYLELGIGALDLELVHAYKVDVDAKKPIKRPSFESVTVSKSLVIANSIDEAVLSNIPDGTVATVFPSGSSITVNGGLLELTFNWPGQYQVMLNKEGYISRTIEIEATS